MMKLINRILIFAIMCVVSLTAVAQKGEAEILLDKAVSVIKSDSGVQMNFAITLLDSSGDDMFKDDGVLKIAGERFALLTDEMKLWCDGETQWSYISQNNEIYISEPNADDARAFSPLHIMELYKSGFKSEVDKASSKPDADAIVLTSAARGNEIKKVSILLDKRINLPTSMVVKYENGTSAKIVVNTYKRGCKFSVKEFRCREKDFRGAEVVDMR